MPRVQDKPISLSLHHHASQLLWGVCALFFVKCWIVHCGQTSPPWSCLSKGHCSISLLVCSDADYAVLPFSFTSGCTSRQALLFWSFSNCTQIVALGFLAAVYPLNYYGRSKGVLSFSHLAYIVWLSYCVFVHLMYLFNKNRIIIIIIIIIIISWYVKP